MECQDYLGVLGETRQSVPVAVHGAEERLGEHSLQLDGIESPLVLSLGLEGMQLWTEHYC